MWNNLHRFKNTTPWFLPGYRNELFSLTNHTDVSFFNFSHKKLVKWSPVENITISFMSAGFPPCTSWPCTILLYYATTNKKRYYEANLTCTRYHTTDVDWWLYFIGENALLDYWFLERISPRFCLFRGLAQCIIVNSWDRLAG